MCGLCKGWIRECVTCMYNREYVAKTERGLRVKRFRWGVCGCVMIVLFLCFKNSYSNAKTIFIVISSKMVSHNRYVESVI